MASSPNYLDPEVLGELKDLSLRAQTIVDGLVTGMHRSPFQGYSVEFAQHREYAPGDDTRHVDWKVFARTDKLHLKQYEDETNLCCWFLVDRSESMRFQGSKSNWSKYDYACCLTIAFAWLILNQRDAVSIALFADQLIKQGRPSDRRESLSELIHILESTPEATSTSLGVSLKEFALDSLNRGVVVVVSDCFDDFESIAAGLESIRRRGHQLLLLQVLDPLEISLEFEQSVELCGMESGPNVRIDPIKLKTAYQQVVDEQFQLLSAFCQKQAILFERVATSRSLAEPLTKILNRLSTGAGR